MCETVWTPESPTEIHGTLMGPGPSQSRLVGTHERPSAAVWRWNPVRQGNHPQGSWYLRVATATLAAHICHLHPSSTCSDVCKFVRVCASICEYVSKHSMWCVLNPTTQQPRFLPVFPAVPAESFCGWVSSRAWGSHKRLPPNGPWHTDSAGVHAIPKVIIKGFQGRNRCDTVLIVSIYKLIYIYI